MYGWHDPSDYFGAIPAPLAASLMAVGGLLGVRWFLKGAADVEHVPAVTAVAGGGVVSIAIVLLMIVTGSSRSALTFGAYFGFVGGIAATIYPKLCLGAAVFGALIASVESIASGHGLALKAVVTTSVAFAVFFPLVWSANVSIRIPRNAKH